MVQLPSSQLTRNASISSNNDLGAGVDSSTEDIQAPKTNGNIAELTATRQPKGIMSRLSGIFGSRKEPDEGVDQNNEGNNTHVDTDAGAEIKEPSSSAWQAQIDEQVNESMHTAQEEPSDSSVAAVEDEQLVNMSAEDDMSAELVNMSAEDNISPELNQDQPVHNEGDGQPGNMAVEENDLIEERAAPKEMPSSSNPRPKKLRPKPAILNDNSFHYTKTHRTRPQVREKDTYEFPGSPEISHETPRKAGKTGQAAKKVKTNATRKGGEGTTSNGESVQATPKRRGRPPKSTPKAKEKEVSHGHTRSSQLVEASEVPRQSGNIQPKGNPPRSGIAAKKVIGRPKKARSEDQRHDEEEEEAEGDSLPDLLEISNPSPENTAKSSRKRKNGELEFSGNGKGIDRPSKKAKTASSVFDYVDDGNEVVEDEDDDDPRPLPQKRPRRHNLLDSPKKPSINLVREVARAEETERQKNLEVQRKERELRRARDAAQDAEYKAERLQTRLSRRSPTINLVRDLATAEDLAGKKRGVVKLKERELRHARRSFEEAESTTEHWRNRLAVAREKAKAKEREEMGLPPLETKKTKVVDFVDFTLDSDEEDFDNGVERVEGVFGTNNRASPVPIPWSNAEQEALIKGLWEERHAGAQRYYNIWRLPIFRRNERSFDEVLAKCIDFKEAMIFDWEKRKQEDPFTEPVQNFILSIRDE